MSLLGLSTRTSVLGTFAIVAIVAALLGATAAVAQNEAEFRIGTPLAEAATGTTAAPALEAVTAASGLTVTLVSDRVGIMADQIALWPDSAHPAHAIICNEGDPRESRQASVQLVDLTSGDVSDMISGLASCDPAKRTPWGTVIVGEEADDGRVYEIIDPLDVRGVTIDRASGTSSDPRVVVRTAMGQLSYEGVVVTPDGTVYYDDARPSAGDRGGIYKFLPATPWTGGPAISDLAQSPLADGSVWVMRLGSGNGSADWTPGSDGVTGAWERLEAPVNLMTFRLRESAQAAGMTGFDHPEDMALDPIAARAGTTRLCWNDTGEDKAGDWGETLCLVDTPADDAASYPAGSVPTVTRFVQGEPELRMPDNMDFDPATGNLWLNMDATTSAEDAAFTNDSVWVCLPDGADADRLSDGCARALTLLDGKAEFTGIEFLADGSGFYQHLQHRAQDGDQTPGTSDMIFVSLSGS